MVDKTANLEVGQPDNSGQVQPTGDLENSSNKIENSGEGNQKASPKGNQKQKKRFHMSFLLKLLLLGAAAFLAVFAYLVITQNPAVMRDELEPEEPQVITKPELENPIKTYTSEKFKFSIQYNTDIHEFERRAAFSTQPPQFVITHQGANQADLDTEKDLTDGYIVKISAYENPGIDALVSAQRKREKFTLECPEITEVREIYSRNIDGAEAKSFEVINCPQNYVENFIGFGDDVLEITQIYRGDIGFKQSYRAQTDEIVRNFKLLRDPEEAPEIASFESLEYQLSFIHPVLNAKCCSVTAPSIEGLEKVVVLADASETDEEGNVLNKLGIFAYPSKGKSFDLFLNEQKQALIQEFKIVEEENPTNLREEVVSVGGRDAYKLVNYAWWGDIVFLEHPNANYFLVFVIPEDATEDFSAVVGEIFASFGFVVEEE
ncbi:hypothetical protein GF360_01440 [candidate division WWE3 bacterium]|nr:hypothetical protein [candidate division WWE3 bacterium]